MGLFKKQEPDEMEQHVERQASARTYSILKKVLLVWWVLAVVLALVMSYDLGYGVSMTIACLVVNTSLPLICYGVLRLVHHIALLVYQSRTGDEAASKKLTKNVLIIAGTVLFLIWVVGSLADLLLRA